MAMYFVGIDISKYKHDCCIISAADQKVVSKFTFNNDTSICTSIILYKTDYERDRIFYQTQSLSKLTLLI